MEQRRRETAEMTGGRLWSAALAILGAYMALTSFGSARVSGDFGPWLMPMGAGTLLVILGVASVFEPARPLEVVPVNFGALAIAGAALLAYPFVLLRGGFLLTTGALAVVLGLISTTRPRWLMAAGGVVAVVAVWAGFTMLLRAHLPTGTS